MQFSNYQPTLPAWTFPLHLIPVSVVCLNKIILLFRWTMITERRSNILLVCYNFLESNLETQQCGLVEVGPFSFYVFTQLLVASQHSLKSPVLQKVHFNICSASHNHPPYMSIFYVCLWISPSVRTAVILAYSNDFI